MVACVSLYRLFLLEYSIFAHTQRFAGKIISGYVTSVELHKSKYLKAVCESFIALFLNRNYIMFKSDFAAETVRNMKMPLVTSTYDM